MILAILCGSYFLVLVILTGTLYIRGFNSGN